MMDCWRSGRRSLSCWLLWTRRHDLNLYFAFAFSSLGTVRSENMDNSIDSNSETSP